MAISIIALRHAPTLWNRQRRIQGRTDVDLDEAGILDTKHWYLSDEDRAREWYSSPLSRCRQTGTALGLVMTSSDALIEMDWGQWEGESLADLRENSPKDMAANEALGLDFRPEGGESPREVQARLKPFMATITDAGRDVGLLTHKGVIRALVAEATGWDMKNEPPVRLTNGVETRFVLEGGVLELEPTR